MLARLTLPEASCSGRKRRLLQSQNLSQRRLATGKIFRAVSRACRRQLAAMDERAANPVYYPIRLPQNDRRNIRG